jgi:hypothetical protein
LSAQNIIKRDKSLLFKFASNRSIKSCQLYNFTFCSNKSLCKYMQIIYLNLSSCCSGSYRVIVGAELPGSRPLDPRDRIIARYVEDKRTNITFKHRLNMELDFQGLFGLLCTAELIG